MDNIVVQLRPPTHSSHVQSLYSCTKGIEKRERNVAVELLLKKLTGLLSYIFGNISPYVLTHSL